MSQLTLGERCFEKFCVDRGIAATRIPESTIRTPDYELSLGGNKVMVEVKDIDLSPEEARAQEQLKRGEPVVLRDTPGRRVRSRVSDAAAQLKGYAEGKFPAILLLFGTGQGARWLDPYDILVGMYGLQTIKLAVPNDPRQETRVTGIEFGQSRSLSEERNTTISAIGALSTPGPNELNLCIYHNNYAAVPLPPAYFLNHGVAQFRIPRSEGREFFHWEKIATADL